jgi:hypothetical protein
MASAEKERDRVEEKLAEVLPEMDKLQVIFPTVLRSRSRKELHHFCGASSAMLFISGSLD